MSENGLRSGEDRAASAGAVDLVRLAERFNTVGAFWHDAYAQWQVVADSQRRTFEDCRLVGWGDTLAEAVAAVDVAQEALWAEQNRRMDHLNATYRPRPEDASNA